MAKQPTQARVKRREKKNITNGVAHVNSSFNNTKITITDVHAALADLLDNVAAREELGQRGRSRAQSEFSWQVCAQRLTAYYQSVISLGAHTADRLETGA